MLVNRHSDEGISADFKCGGDQKKHQRVDILHTNIIILGPVRLVQSSPLTESNNIRAYDEHRNARFRVVPAAHLRL